MQIVLDVASGPSYYYVMRFSIKVQYGLQALLELAENYGQGPVGIASIARRERIPVRFLEQLLLSLKKRGLAESVRGKQGGYSLKRSPASISLLEVVEALDGPIELGMKGPKKSSIIREAFDNLEDTIKTELNRTSLEKLTVKKKQKEGAITYII